MGDTTHDWSDRVRERAHAIWEREGRPEGAAERHWAEAEEELRAEERGQPDPGAAEVLTSTGGGRAPTHRAGIDV